MADIDGVIRRTSFAIKIDPKAPIALFINEVLKSAQKVLESFGKSCIFFIEILFIKFYNDIISA